MTSPQRRHLSQRRQDNEARIECRATMFAFRPAQGRPSDAKMAGACAAYSPAQAVISRVQQPVSLRAGERVFSVHPGDTLTRTTGPCRQRQRLHPVSIGWRQLEQRQAVDDRQLHQCHGVKLKYETDIL